MQKYTKTALYLCIVSAVLYNSWPLGYLLNYKVAHIALASVLEASGQPFNWLFITTDIMTGLVTLAAVGLIWLKIKPLLNSRAWAAIATGLCLFGLFTLISALMPLKCQTITVSCGVQASQILSLHDITGGLASLGTFISLVGVFQLVRQFSFDQKIRGLILLTLLIWSASGILFAILSEVNAGSLRMQQVFLILTGLAVVIVGLAISKIKPKIDKSTSNIA